MNRSGLTIDRLEHVPNIKRATHDVNDCSRIFRVICSIRGSRRRSRRMAPFDLCRQAGWYARSEALRVHRRSTFYMKVMFKVSYFGVVLGQCCCSLLPFRNTSWSTSAVTQLLPNVCPYVCVYFPPLYCDTRCLVCSDVNALSWSRIDEKAYR